jgi:S-adenosyl-L-methionine hydrolase (adenosine-forming)
VSSAILKNPIITLLTDFGTSDYYVGAMKGVIMSQSPGTRIIDISHEIAPQAVLSGAYVLLGAYREFPDETIHLAVVDPGVGSSRRGIILRTDRYFFVGPDNGLFSLAAPQPAAVYEIKPSAYLAESTSSTFHGRDVFAPVAAALAIGVRPEDLGSVITDPRRLPQITRISSSEIQSQIIHIDRFGNAVTGIERVHLANGTLPFSFSLRVSENLIEVQKQFYAEEPLVPRRPFVIWGSLNFLEISLAQGSAAEVLGLSRGQAVTLELG